MIHFLKRLVGGDAAAPASVPAQQFPPSTTDRETEEKVLSFCRAVANLLQIDLPQFRLYGLVFTSKGIVQCQYVFDEASLPHNAEPHGAYYFDDLDLIAISTTHPKLVRRGKKYVYQYEDATFAELIFTCCHELRHVWQKKYHEKEYYGHNAIGSEVINDIAEVDADAFALAYMFSDHTTFNLKDLPAQMQQVGLQADLDNGKRWKRAKQLYKEYGFGSAGEIIKLENQVKLKYADLLNTLSQRK